MRPRVISNSTNYRLVNKCGKFLWWEFLHVSYLIVCWRDEFTVLGMRGTHDVSTVLREGFQLSETYARKLFGHELNDNLTYVYFQ